MKKVKKFKLIGLLLFTMFFGSMLAQKTQIVGDSLAGFDEDAAKRSALSEGFFGNEFPVRMNGLKRQYINNKYNLKYPSVTPLYRIGNHLGNNNSNQRITVAPACQNEDFEASVAAQITTNNQISGWTVDAGSNQFPSNSCNLSGCCPNPPSESLLITAPATGYLDPIVGPQYPIYSVFGTSNNNGIGSNPQLGIPAMYGTNFIRLNNEVNDYSIERLSKTFAVTANNALFQFAFISVFATGHLCCDAASFQIQLINASTNSVLTCPAFSISAPGAACTTTNPLQYYVAGSNTPYTNQAVSYIYNKWKLNTLDLTAYINQNITIQIVSTDCDAGGHWGCVFFDAQCSPMTVVGNNSQFPAGSQTITLPTCGANGATITLPTGLGPYSWQGPGVPGTYSIPSFTNQTYITAISGTLLATMNPAGACAPINRLITVTVTPAPNLILTPIQPSCSNSVATLTGTLTIGALPMNVVVTGPTGTVGVNVVNNTLAAPTSSTGLVAGVNTVVVTDGIGCNITKTVLINPPLAIPQFSVGSPGNNYTLTCLNTPINMTATSNGPPLTYTWTSSSGTLTGNSANISQPGNWQVVGQSPASGCSVSVNFTIYSNFSSPTIAVTPTVQNITCNVAGSCFTLTTNNSLNIVTNWFQVSGTNTVYVGVASGTINIFCPNSAGVYWAEAKDLITGCTTTKSVQVTASIGVPQFTVTSPSNFTIGCSTTSVTSMQVSSVITSPVANVAVGYTFCPPPATTVITPTTALSINPNQNGVIIPGVWVVYVKDLTNNCLVSQSISIIQNTIAPNVAFIQPLSFLTCANPSMVLQGISSNSNTVITWTVPAVPSNSIDPTPNATVVINPAIAGATNVLTSVGIYTVGAVDNNNLCKSSTTVQINQDVRLPIFTISALTNSVINCFNTDVLIVPIITPTLAVALVPTYIWYPPVGPGVPGTQFNTTAPGTHTAISTSATNGCTTTATYNVAEDLQNPAVDFTPIYTLDCGSSQATVVTVVTPTNNLKYYWNIFPAGVVVTDRTKPFIYGTQVGEYGVTVTNTLNGCVTNGAYEVVQGSLTVDFTANPSAGFAPLHVNFQNNSASTFTTGVMTATWSFGNGTTYTCSYSSTTTPVPNTIYTAAGTYSVLLLANKGTCSGSKVEVITVDVPSKLEVPNVFTPNGDKVNDIFRLISSNLTTIQATIFDRWGNKVYDVDSDTGNIAWDGKNMSGKDCPAGVYFYLIKATGKDNQTYNLKGDVTLFR